MSARKSPPVEKIAELILAGNTLEEIAASYGVTRQAIHQVLKAKGQSVEILSPPKKPRKWDRDDRIEDLRALVEAEVPLKEIAASYGITRRWLQEIMRQNGIKAKRGS